jgi:hypothetical protein
MGLRRPLKDLGMVRVWEKGLEIEAIGAAALEEKAPEFEERRAVAAAEQAILWDFRGESDRARRKLSPLTGSLTHCRLGSLGWRNRFGGWEDRIKLGRERVW